MRTLALRFAGLVVVGLLMLAAQSGMAAPPAERPNVVMILSDDQAWGDFGFMGHPAIETPSFDRLAAEGLTFTRGYVPASLCRPSLATLATGLFPHQHKITSNDPPKGLPKDEFLRQRQEMIAYIDKVPTLPRMLAARGYRCMQTGKWWEGNPSRGGFTAAMTHGDPRRGGRHGDVGLKIGREGMQPIFNFIDGCQDQPFFLWYAPFMPHRPHTPPAALLEKYQKKTDSIHVARYWAMCEWFDQTCGQLFDYLDNKGLTDNTLVVFVTDNGWIQKPDAPGYAEHSKRSQYDGGIRTPIMLRWPNHIKPCRDEKTLVSSVDLVPTILEACGLEPTAAMPGINLLDRDATAKRDTIFGDIYLHNAVDIHRPASSLMYRWCINGPWKLIVPNKANVPAGEIELYNVVEDPHEKQNLAARQPARVDQLQAQLDTWWAGR